MNDIEKRIAAALDAAEPEELDALLDGVETETVAIRERRIGKSALKKAGLRNSTERAHFSGKATRFIAAAAVLVFVIGTAFGVTAYAKEVKEYNEAMRFFNENTLPTDGLSRSEIKEVYRSFTSRQFTAGEAGGVIEVGRYKFDLSGLEFAAHPAAPADYSALWSRSSFEPLPESGAEYAVNLYGGLLPLFDEGVHYVKNAVYSQGGESVVRSTLEEYQRGEQNWQVAFDNCTIDAFEAFDGCVFVVGRRGSDPAGRLGFIARNDSSGLHMHNVGSAFASRRIFSILEEEDGSFTLFASELKHEAGFSTVILRYSRNLDELSEAEFCCPEGYYASRAVHFGGGYALLLQATFWDWNESGGDMARQMIAFTDPQGRIIGTSPVALDTVARETLAARDTDEIAQDDPSLLSIDLDESCFVIVDMLEYGGKLYFSGYALPRGSYSITDEPNPSSHHDEILPILLAAAGNEYHSEAGFTALVRANYTALMIEFDPANAAPAAFCLEAGALGNSLRVDASGRLVWNVCSIQRAGHSLATSAFSLVANTAVYEYRFTASGVVCAADTGARVIFRR